MDALAATTLPISGFGDSDYYSKAAESPGDKFFFSVM